MNSNMQHNNSTTGAAAPADHHADTGGVQAFSPQSRTNLTDDERADAHAAIDCAMQSVGQVLEAALQAMANLRNARATLAPPDDGQGARLNLGAHRQAR
ncbi:hypothetical protein G3N57_27280 [Paraburkholderia sp. Se-20369]|nr:hypothetical protein [Paraburkholderia sp. Se-20369]